MSVTRETSTGFLSATELGQVSTNRGYDGFGELEDFESRFQSNQLYSYTLGRDAAGRITSKTETISGEEHTWSYSYDEAGRLVQTELDGRVYEQIVYDENSNRTEYTDSSGTIVTADYDDQDRLLRYGDTTFTYTANGELLTKADSTGTTTYTYDVFGNLTDVELPDGRRIHYIIDGRNRRVGKDVDGRVEWYLVYIDQLNPVLQLDADGNVVAEFVYGTRLNVPDYMVKGGRTYRIVADHLGSVRLVVDTSTGEVVQRIDYDPWGVVLQDSNPGFQPFGFAGGLYDADTGLVRFGARDYNSENGRWTARDILDVFATAGNHYVYVHNAPQSFTDPSGYQSPFGPCLGPQTTGDWLRENLFGGYDDTPFSADPGWQSRADRFMAWFCSITGIPSLAGAGLSSIIGAGASKLLGNMGIGIFAVCATYQIIRAYQ